MRHILPGDGAAILALENLHMAASIDHAHRQRQKAHGMALGQSRIGDDLGLGEGEAIDGGGVCGLGQGNFSGL